MILRKKNNGLKHDPQIEISFVKKIDNTHTQKKTLFLTLHIILADLEINLDKLSSPKPCKLDYMCFSTLL